MNKNLHTKSFLGETMMKTKDQQVLTHFRKNSRESLTNMSRQTRIPISTLFDKLKDYEKNKIIQKHTCILDFKKIGYDLRIQLLVNVHKKDRQKLQNFLKTHPKVNNVYRVSNGYDFIIETIFQKISELDSFNSLLDRFEIIDRKELFVMEEVKREEFHFETVPMQNPAS